MESIIPGPVHIPPGVAAVILKDCAKLQTGETGVIVALVVDSTIITIESDDPQTPEIVCIIRCVPTPAKEGSNIPVDVFVIPAPDQTPPWVTAEKENGFAVKQKLFDDNGLIEGSGELLTTMVV